MIWFEGDFFIWWPNVIELPKNLSIPQTGHARKHSFELSENQQSTKHFNYCVKPLSDKDNLLFKVSNCDYVVTLIVICRFS